MKMIKRTLIAIAVVALLATSVHAGLSEHYLSFGDSRAVKVDGKETQTFRWPYQISYDALVICNIPVTMDVGMYVQVIDCADKKINMVQVNCDDIGKSGKYPCYKGCTTFDVVANFEVKLGAVLHKTSDILKGAEAFYEGGDVVPGDGSATEIKLCVKAWEAQLQNHPAQDKVSVANVDITVKPNT
jgi:hypothetical protein